jgi:hypothetical protein
MNVWTKDKAWDWYRQTPWLRGCNYMSCDCANRIDQWQELGFEKRLETADKELELAASIGYNSIRLILEFIVWEQEHDGFMERFDRYLTTAYKHGIRSLIVFGNDCMPPKDEHYRPLKLGKQSYDWGYHGGRKHSQHQQHNQMGYHLLDEPELAEKHYEWVHEIMNKYKHDPRIVVWDLYNEAGNVNRDTVTIPHVKKFFEIARDVNPDQPITSCLWKGLSRDNKLPEVEQYILENSDIISYHNYGSYQNNIQIIKRLKEYGRPILNTEWLARMTHNTVQEMYPLFYLEKIGCYNWGLVAGLYQTYEPWNGLWQRYDAGKGENLDFTKWFHDLFRPNHRPYDPNEIDLIKKFNKLADEDFEKETKST